LSTVVDKPQPSDKPVNWSAWTPQQHREAWQAADVTLDRQVRLPDGHMGVITIMYFVICRPNQ
jgi:hypothetical protein